MRPQLIETIRVLTDGRMPLLPWHIERLGASATALGYRWSIDAPQRAIARAAAPLQEGVEHRLRLLFDDDGKMHIETSVLPALPTHRVVALAAQRLDAHEPLLRHKTTHRPWYDHARDWIALDASHIDLLYLNQRGQLCEGSRTNVYLRIDGEWLTPPLENGLLPGVQRAALLDDEQVRECALDEHDLRRASGIRVSNALRGWLDVQLQDSTV